MTGAGVRGKCVVLGHCPASASNPSETGAAGSYACPQGVPPTSAGGLEEAGWKQGGQWRGGGCGPWRDAGLVQGGDVGTEKGEDSRRALNGSKGRAHRIYR